MSVSVMYCVVVFPMLMVFLWFPKFGLSTYFISKYFGSQRIINVTASTALHCAIQCNMAQCIDFNFDGK